MKSKIYFLSVVIALVLMAVMMAGGNLSHSQLVSGQDIESVQEISVLGTENKIKNTSKGLRSEESPILNAQPKAENRVERIYVNNRDGTLQKEEMINFLSEVVLAVERKGSFYVSSKLLNKFDHNHDNRISQNEISTIKKLLVNEKNKKKQ